MFTEQAWNNLDSVLIKSQFSLKKTSHNGVGFTEVFTTER